MNDRQVLAKLVEAINKKDWNLVEDVLYVLHSALPPEGPVENEGSCFNNDDLPGERDGKE